MENFRSVNWTIIKKDLEIYTKRRLDEQLRVLLKEASAQSATQALGYRYRNNKKKRLNIWNDEIKQQ
jgi:hypothetical protein